MPVLGARLHPPGIAWNMISLFVMLRQLDFCGYEGAYFSDGPSARQTQVHPSAHQFFAGEQVNPIMAQFAIFFLFMNLQYIFLSAQRTS
jgi:hypothetical protein